MVFPASVFRVVSSILNEIEESMRRSSLLEDFKMSELPALKAKCIELVELLVTIKSLRMKVLRLTMQLFLIAGY